MIVLIDPISANIDMYVPAYPLPLLEIAAFVKAHRPRTRIQILSIPGDYGVPLTATGKEEVYGELLRELRDLNPTGVGISCTGVAQAREAINLCEKIKAVLPRTCIFLGGYFPTLYYEEIFELTSAVDLVVAGEGEIPALEIIRRLENGQSPFDADIPNLVWRQRGLTFATAGGLRFKPADKARLRLDLLRRVGAYDILPYAFSRGCGFRCRFCMEQAIRPQRLAVPRSIVEGDLKHLVRVSGTRTLLISDALFQSFELFPLLRDLGVRANFETRCDVLQPSVVERFSDVCGSLAIGLESASYATLKRMNKVRNRDHFRHYLTNTEAVFYTAVDQGIPIMVFMIAGYPGDTEADLEESLRFARRLARYRGDGGHVFKIGECRVYPRTRLYEQASAMAEVVFDNDGAFGENVVRQPSPGLPFQTVLDYMQAIFKLSHPTAKLLDRLLTMMPFFRLPAQAIVDPLVPDDCFRGPGRHVFGVSRNNLAAFRRCYPALSAKYARDLCGQRSARRLAV